MNISSSSESQPTPYPAVNRVLHDLLGRIRPILNNHFMGMYLYGSLATGGFEPSRSDIDFVVITAEHLPETTIADLSSIHMALAGKNGKWEKKLEGAYVPQAIIRRHDSRHPPVPTLNEGRFYMAPLGSDWVIQRHVLREAGVRMAGPPPADLIDPVEPQALQTAVLDILAQWWQPMLDTPSRLRDPGYQPFAVLSMCRALYTVQKGELASKATAAKWARAALPATWSPLINHALQWREGNPIESIEHTMAFMRDVIAQCIDASS